MTTIDARGNRPLSERSRSTGRSRRRTSRGSATLSIEATGVSVDYSGTSPMSRYGVNVPMAYTAAYTCFGLSCAIAPEVPNNAGSLAPFLGNNYEN